MKEKLPNEDYVIPDITATPDATELFKNLSEDKLASVKELIADIEVMIANRNELNKEILKQLDKVNLELDNTITKFQGTASAANSGEIMKVLGELRKKKVELEELKLQEKLNFWRDVAQLKKELREHIKELREKESKSSLIDTLLEQ
jgi:hypothetical protein